MSRLLRSFRAAAGIAAMAMAGPSLVVAQGMAQPPVTPDSITVAGGTRYQASAFHRWVSGNTYRDLWATSIRVPVLDWRTYGGGLHPTKLGGGSETRSLRFVAADGNEFVFRLSDKVVNNTPKLLRNTPAAGVVQDEISAYHPAAAVIAAPIVEASGVLHPTAVFMVIARDSGLEAFHGGFGGHLGMIEAYPNVPKGASGFGRATKIIDSDELLKLMDSDAREHVDARAFLSARLTDILINDNDRHPGNWKWARLESGPKNLWEPIARDRDHAFISYDGWLTYFAKIGKPSLVTWSGTPDVAGLTRPTLLDARVLAGLEQPVWDSIARALQWRITDSVIAAAAHAMPIEYQATVPALEAVLKERRAALPEAARQYYRMLAARVEIHGTDAADRAVISRVSNGYVDVRLESDGREYYSRRFDARETSEILVYLHGGTDTAVVTGHVQSSILVRVIGGNGTNTLLDSSTVAGHHRSTHLYDQGTVAGVNYEADTMFDRRPWEKVEGKLVPHQRDNGTSIAPVYGLGFHSRIGTTPLLGVTRYTYGFSDRPYSSMVSLQGEYAMKYKGYRVNVLADKRLESSPLHFTAIARLSDLEMINFVGFGNTTIDSGTTNSYFEVHQRQWMLHPAVALAVGQYTDISLGPVIQHSTTDSAPGRYLAATRPYGFGTFNQVGVQFNATYGWRDPNINGEHTHHQLIAEVHGAYYPAAMDIKSAFEKVTATVGASIALPIPAHPYFLFRAGAKKVFGDFPFYEAALIGGDATTRYMDAQQYAGDQALYATSEVRIPIARFSLMMPLRAGIMGVAEAGRVYYKGTSLGGWNPRTGEGVWLGFGTASSVLTLLHTTQPGHNGINIGFGLNF